MIRLIEKCMCDFCGKEFNDKHNLKRIEIFDTSVTAVSKMNVDMCNDCLEDFVSKMRPMIRKEARRNFSELKSRTVEYEEYMVDGVKAIEIAKGSISF